MKREIEELKVEMAKTKVENQKLKSQNQILSILGLCFFIFKLFLFGTLTFNLNLIGQEAHLESIILSIRLVYES